MDFNKEITVELNKTTICEDLFFHFLYKFPRSEWNDLNKQELINYINGHIPANPSKMEYDRDYHSHEYYIVLSHIHNRVNEPISVYALDDDKFKEWYKIAMEFLIHHGIWSTDEVLNILYENS